MMSLSHRTSSFFLLTGLVAALLSGCSAVKRVEPYSPQGGGPTTEVMATRPQEPLPGVEGAQPQGQVVPPGTAGQQAPAAQPPSAEELLPVLTQVDDRIAAYEEKLRAWQGFTVEAEKQTQPPELDEKIANCQGRLQTIIASYNQLHELLIRLGPGQSPDSITMERLQGAARDDIAFLESECRLFITGDQQAGSLFAGTAARELEKGEKAIATAMAAGDHPRVITLYEQLPAVEGRKPSFESVFSYGQSLLHTGREQDAGQVFTSLLQDVQQQNQAGREFQLMQLVADIQFGLEEYNSAFAGYVNIINRYAGLGENIEWARKQQAVISARNQQGAEVKGFAALMRAYLGFNQARDGFKVVLLAEQFLASFPESTVIPTVNRILFETRDSAEAWYAGNLQRIGELKEQKKYGEALQILQVLPLQEIPPDKKAQLQAFIDEMTTVQVQEAEMQHAAEEASLQETWSKGQNHLQLKEYDQAIAVFSGMLNTSYADRARGEINAAANLAAQEDRRKAAELFVQAGSAKEPATRVTLLLQSRQLLQDILNKYPQSDLGDKVRKNLDRIENDLRAIDPALLTASAPVAEQGSGGPPAASPPDGTMVNVGEEQVVPGPGVPPGSGIRE
ncbi:MAG: hypothetical protein ACYC9M_00030 [Desulfobulbaceae bacterium]